jgi:hypothetical protein
MVNGIRLQVNPSGWIREVLVVSGNKMKKKNPTTALQIIGLQFYGIYGVSRRHLLLCQKVATDHYTPVDVKYISL